MGKSRPLQARYKAREETRAFLPGEPRDEVDEQGHTKEKLRNLVAFWIFGACSSYMYVVMLSAAYDILEDKYTIGTTIPEYLDMLTLKQPFVLIIGEQLKPEQIMIKNATSQELENVTSRGKLDCNPLSTGTVLLAIVVPDMLVALSAPWCLLNVSYDIKILLSVTSSVVSCLIVALSPFRALTLFGVVCAGMAGGIGEFTCVSLASFYDKSVVSPWSSGTGAAGIVGSIAYAGLTGIMTPRNAILMYWCVLVRVPTSKRAQNDVKDPDRLEEYDPFEGKCKESEERRLSFKERVQHFQYLLKYIIPLWLVYFGSYFINHGLLELIFVPGIWLSHKSQYRWFQVLYQIGVFISRSSINLLTCRWLWVFPILQWSVLVLILTGVYFQWTPSIALIFGIIFFEGIISGASYVNTFYHISQNEELKYKEFAMGATMASESCGIAIAGVIAIPVHDALCRM